jgi:Tol biopolymer transport system component/DNA-binding winged helix-turn-helix (wHTH) protein
MTKYGIATEKRRKERKVSTRPANTQAEYCFDGFTVDVEQHTLTHGDETLLLPSRAFDTLIYLLAHRGRCVPKDELIAEIWRDVVVTDDSLIHAISVLRRVLGDGRGEPRYIQTVPRRGYRFIATVEVAQDAVVLSEATAIATRAVAPDAPRRFGSWVSYGPSAVVAGIAGAAAAVLAILVLDDTWLPASVDSTASIRLYQTAPPGTRIVSGGILSPDGGYLAFVARDDSRDRTALWTRALGSSELRRIAGTDGASKPFWSPDSRRIAYFANGELYVVGIDGGDPRTVAPVFAAAGGSWGSDDTILYAEWASGLFAIPASGDGEVTNVLTLDRNADDIAVGWPQFFPDGRRFIYQIVSLDADRSGVYVGDLDGAEPVRLLETPSPAVLAPPRHLLHVRETMLIAEEFDLERLTLTGRAFVVTRGLSPMTLAAENVMSASADLLAFQHGVVQQNLGWFDRDGVPLGTLALPTALFNPRIAPDGRRLLASSSVTSSPGLWLADLDQDQYSRLETDAIGPVWSPDGQRIAFTSRRGLDMIVRSIDGAARQVLISDASVKILNDWSPDGASLVYTQQAAETGLDLWVVDTATGESRSLLATSHSETQARISPDGRWIAYASDEAGELETYVARFPGLEDRRQISSGGGGQPQWRADGGELFYLSFDRAVMAVAIGPGSPPGFAAPEKLFRAPVAGDPGDAREYYATDPSGTRILVDGAVSENDGQSITIMVNWADGNPEPHFETASAEQSVR